MNTLKYILRLTLTLFLITAVVAGLLGLADYLTADKIAEIIKNAGTNLVGVKVISFGGFLMFGGTLTPELETELVKWVEDMVAGCV